MTGTRGNTYIPISTPGVAETALKRHLAGRWVAVALGILACFSVIATYMAIRGMDPFGPDSIWVSRLLVTDLALLLILVIFISPDPV